MPDPRQHTMPRKERARDLHEAIERYPLVVLCAPVGYGKTALAREVMDQWKGEAVCTSIAPGGDDAAFLWKRVCAQIAPAAPDLAALLREAGPPLTPDDGLVMGEKLGEYTSKTPLLWVVDDAHHRHAASMEANLAYLTTAGIPGLHFLLVSRAVPPISLRELRLKGRAEMFRQDFCRFTPEETERFFIFSGICDTEAAQSAHAACHGWPTGVGLLAQAYLQGRNITQKRRMTDSSLPELDKLLEEAVFSRHTPDEKQLLMQLAVADSFTLSQAAAISLNPAAEKLVTALYDGNAFIDYDMRRGAFRIHPLYRSLLLSLLRAEGQDTAALHRRSAEWLLESGDTPEAVFAFADAGSDEDFLRILEVFAEKGANVIQTVAPVSLPPRVFAIPWDVRLRQMTGYLAFLLVYLQQIDTAKGARLLAEAEEHVAESALPDEEKRRLQGEITLLRGYARFNDLKGLLSWSKKAYRLLRGPSRIFGRHLIWAFGSLHLGFLLSRAPGGYASTVRYVDANHPFLTRIMPGCGAGGHAALRAEFLLETSMGHDTLDRVETAAHMALREAGKTAQSGVIAAASLTLARLALIRKEPEQALDTIRQLYSRKDIETHPLIRPTVDAALEYVTACAAVQGHTAPPAAGRPDRRKADEGIYRTYPCMSFLMVVEGKTLYLQRQAAKLAALAGDMMASLAERHALAIVHAKLFAALAEDILHGPNAALPFFREAVEAAKPDALILTFAEYGSAILPLVDLLIEELPPETRGRSGMRAYLTAIRDAAEEYAL